MRSLFSKKHLYFLGTAILGTLIFFACTNKEIVLVTNIDFDPVVTAQEEGFVKDSLPTIVGVVPQRPYPDYYYYASYEVKEGEGYFIDAKGAVVEINEKQYLPQDSAYMAEWNYIGTTAGKHSVVFSFNDNYERNKTVIFSYDIKNVPVIWEAAALNDVRKVKDSIAVDLKLENLKPEFEVSYTYAITMQEGAGQLLKENLEIIEKGKSDEIVPGTKRITFIPAQGGINTLLFTLTDSNDHKVVASLSLDIEGESINLPPVAKDDEVIVMMHSDEDQILDLLANDTDPEGDQLELAAIVTEPQYGTIVINEDGTLTYVPNENAITAESDTFTYRIKDIPAGNSSENEATVTVKFVTKETIAIPDPYFEQYLIDTGLDTDGLLNKMMFKEDALKVTTLDIEGQNGLGGEGIDDFTGIEHFENLVSLKFQYHGVKELDLSKNTKLESISYAYTSIASVFGDLPNLKSISVGFIGTMNVNFSTLPSLERINSGLGATLSIYDFSNLTKLKEISLSGDTIEDPINLTNTPALEKLALLDITTNVVPNSLDLSNHMGLLELQITGTKNFECIQVSDIIMAMTNTAWSIPESASYALDCSPPEKETISIPDEYFEQYLINEGFDTDGELNALMYKEDAMNVTAIEIIGNQTNSVGVNDFTGIEYFVNLKSLKFEYHGVKEIDLSKTTKLESISYAYTTITSVFKDLPNLKSITCGFIGTMNVDFSSLPALERISMGLGANLSNYNFSNLTQLKSVRLSSDSSIEEMVNLTNTPALEELIFNGTKVGAMYKALDLQNHPNLLELNITGNDSFACIQVSDITAATNNTNWIIPDTARYSLDCDMPAKETISIPDMYFEQYLINEGFDTDGELNMLMYKEDALLVKAIEIIGNQMTGVGVNDFTGIEHFENLESLKFEYHGVKEIDLSKNTKLESISYAYTTITSVFKDLPNLKSITTGFIGTMDVDFSTLPALELISIGLGANLSNYNFGNLTQLKSVRLSSDSSIEETVNLTNTPSLEKLTLANVKVGEMYKSLDLSGHPNLLELSISGSDTFDCVQVADVMAATNNPSWSIPSTARYAIDCSQPAKETISIPDDFFEQYLIDEGFDTDGILNGMMYKEDALNVTSINVNGSSGIGQDIDDFSGIAYFENLKTLEFHDHGDLLLDVSQNTKLESIAYTYSEINTVIENLPNLKFISVGYVSLVKIDFSTLPSLEAVINETGAKFSTYNFSNLTQLKQLELVSDDVIDGTFSLTNTPALEKLTFSNTKVGAMYKSLDISGHPNLLELKISGSNTFDCVQVVDVMTATSNPNWSIPSTTRYAIDCSQPAKETISIPDDFFEQYLINEGHDTDGILNGMMYKEDALKVLEMDIQGQNGLGGESIDDFTGIEHFENLVSLRFQYHSVSDLDLSKNTKLETLFYAYTTITSVFKNIPKLKSINIGFAKMNVDFATLPSLEVVSTGSGGSFTNYNFENSTSLKRINLGSSNNLQETLNLTNTPSLEKLTLANAKVGEMYKSLDLSGHPNLLELSISGRDTFDCVQVADVMAATNNPSWSIPGTARYAIDCSQPIPETVEISDANFEQYLIDAGYDTDGMVNGKMLKSDALNITEINIVSSRGITDFSSTTIFENLRTVKMDFQGSVPLDFSQNQKLESISLFESGSTIIVKNLPNLSYLRVGQADVLSIDTTSLPAMQEFVLFEIGTISSYNFSNLPNLYRIRLLTETTIEEPLNIVNTPALEDLYFEGNVGAMYKSLDLTSHTNLIRLNILGNDTFDCIQVTDVMAAANNIKWAIPDTSRYSLDCSEPVIETIPITDANFEQFLITENYDTDKVVNGQMSKEDASGIIKLEVKTDLGIIDFSSIKYFENLQTVFMWNQGDVLLDFSQNKKLEHINIFKNTANLTIDDFPNLKRLVVMESEALIIDYESLPVLEELLLLSVKQVSSYNFSSLTGLIELGMRGQVLGEELILPNSNSLEELSLNDVKSLLTNSIDLTNYMNILNLNILGTENGDFFECIQVSDIDTAMNNPNWQIPDTSNYSLDCSQP